MCVYIIALVVERIYFSWLPIIGEKIERAIMWLQFTSFKGFLNRRKRSRHLQVLKIWIFYPLICITSEVEYIKFVGQ